MKTSFRSKTKTSYLQIATASLQFKIFTKSTLILTTQSQLIMGVGTYKQEYQPQKGLSGNGGRTLMAITSGVCPIILKIPLFSFFNQNNILFNFNQCNESLNYRISSDVWPPSQTVVEDGCTSSECFKGTLADIFTSIQPILNFTFTITKNGVAGIGLENGTWTGQIGRDKISDIESLNLNHFLIILR